jgi:hypothetical protein
VPWLKWVSIKEAVAAFDDTKVLHQAWEAWIKDQPSLLPCPLFHQVEPFGLPNWNKIDKWFTLPISHQP